ncbi:hypothetical protein TNIN_273261 [Trichonephila inaurata madagascariensis]|uniref:Uncharacterized protein n=1 Tax=Trichonephila inaurata madagascariensis TaxID=2747483 RepID=A0A8X6KGJ8_9ARAC|nr:hypothetical protein TNIN_273261 [Trichonephila inaurata madagascariensis]
MPIYLLEKIGMVLMKVHFRGNRCAPVASALNPPPLSLFLFQLKGCARGRVRHAWKVCEVQGRTPRERRTTGFRGGSKGGGLSHTTYCPPSHSRVANPSLTQKVAALKIF